MFIVSGLVGSNYTKAFHCTDGKLEDAYARESPRPYCRTSSFNKIKCCDYEADHVISFKKTLYIANI